MNIPLFLQGYNFNRQTEIIALDLIALSTGYRIPISKINFGTPVVMDIRPDLDSYPNTYCSAFVNRQYDSRIGGKTGFLYRRLPFNLLEPGDTSTKISPPKTPFKTSDVLDQINLILNSKLTLNDVVELSYSGEDDEMTLLTNPDSLVWIGIKTFTVDTGHIPPIVTNTNLSGFNIYHP